MKKSLKSIIFASVFMSLLSIFPQKIGSSYEILQDEKGWTHFERYMENKIRPFFLELGNIKYTSDTLPNGKMMIIGRLLQKRIH